MPFDPDAYLKEKEGAPVPAGGGFDPDAYLAAKEAEQPKTSEAGAFFAHAGKQAPLGFGDRIYAGFNAAVGDGTYDGNLRKAQRYLDTSEAEHPGWSTAGGVAGGVASVAVPGLGVARGAGLAAKLGTGALAGGIVGVGNSRGDLTTAEGLKDAGKNAVVGAGAGALTAGAFHGTGKAIGAAGRAVRSVAKPITERLAGVSRAHAQAELKAAQQVGGEALAEAELRFGPLVAADDAASVAAAADPRLAKAAARDSMKGTAMQDLEFAAGNRTKRRAFGPEGVRREAIEKVMDKDTELQRVVGESYKEALELTKQRLGVLGSRLDSEVYEVAAAHTPGVGMKAVTSPMVELSKKLAGRTATAPQAKIVDKEVASFFRIHGMKKGEARVPLQTLREEYRGWQDLAEKARNTQGELSPRAQVSSDMANIMRTALHAEIERVSVANPALGNLRGQLLALNEETSAYAAIKSILKEGTTNKAAAAPTFGEFMSPLQEMKIALQRKAMDKGKAGIAGLHSITLRSRAAGKASSAVSGEASAGAASAVGGEAGAAASNVDLGRVARFARSGGDRIEAIGAAMRAGLSRKAAETAVDYWSKMPAR